MKESQFQKAIIDLARTLGWKVWHVPAPMRWDPGKKAWVPAREGAGLPDLILMHDDPPSLVFMEVKTRNGTLSAAQREFLGMAKAISEYGLTTNVGVCAVWPDDWHLIETMLKTRIVA